jgi:spore coat protein A
VRRRYFLKQGLWSSVGILCAGRSPLKLLPDAQHSDHSSKSDSALTPYVDPLSIPQTMDISPGQTVLVPMREFYQKVHRDLNPSRMWGYSGMWPGPTIKVKRGCPFIMEWQNRLPTRHFLPIDHTLHGAESILPEVRTVVHLHGAQVKPESDGYPEAWYTSDGKRGPSYVGRAYQYPNGQRAATLWYHDHAIGINRLNIYAGLAGFYLITDEHEASLNLPNGPHDIPLMIQDRKFTSDGSLFYPTAFQGTHPVWVQEFFGDVNCVNGKIAPFLEVEPRKYRFRLLNASNSRTYYLTLVSVDDDGKTSRKSVNAMPFYQIGTDGGLLRAPCELYYLVISPGERCDVVIDFTNDKGKQLAMVNDAPGAVRPDDSVPREVLLFKVTKPLLKRDDSVLPPILATISPIKSTNAVTERSLSLTESERQTDGYTIRSLLAGKHWDDPITERPRADSVEIWAFANATRDIHPMHLHLVQFQVVNRQPFDVNAYLGRHEIVYTGVPRAPEGNELYAWKDTVKTFPGTITRIVAKFELPPGIEATSGTAFRYVWHCHILEHEDNEMMRPYEVLV